MTSGSEANDAALVRWATRQLGLDETAAADAVRAAVRARLAQDDFLPGLRRQQAVQLLCRADRPKVLPPLALDDEEQRLREEIDEFVQRFFQLGRAERRRQWWELQRQCQQFPTLYIRLSALEAGLDAPGTDALPADPFDHELAEYLQSLFTARRSLQPGLRRALLQRLEPEVRRWSAVAWGFQENYPSLAALDTQFVQQLANWGQRKKMQAKGRRQRIPLTTESSASTGGGSSSGGQYAWIVIVILVGLLRLLTSGCSSNNSPLPTGPIQFEPSRKITFNPHPLQTEILKELDKKQPGEFPDAVEFRCEVASARSWLDPVEWVFLLDVVKTPVLLTNDDTRRQYAIIREKLQSLNGKPLRRDPAFPP